LLDLIAIVERMHFGEIAYEFLEIIIINDKKLGKLTRKELEILKKQLPI
jgi:hypothetical protein